jgi:hypothetical protein
VTSPLVAREPCERCNDTKQVYLASFVTPLGLAPWDEGPETGPCPDCAVVEVRPGEHPQVALGGAPYSPAVPRPFVSASCPTVGRDGDAHHTPHDVSADVDRRTP